MKAVKLRTIVYISGLFLLSSLAKQCEKHITILISLDGFRADYVNRLFFLKNHTTYIGDLMMGSAYASSGIRSVFPSITFPNHMTMATGKYVDEHEPDYTGHHYGPDSHHIDRKLLEIDNNIGYLISSLQHADFYDKANIILTSDHGMTAVRDEVVIPPRHDFKIWSEHDSYWLIQPNPGNEFYH
ncbi:hypothetical protein D917_00074 [Trichinella nativa]|uniref:Uncharacterized protein n=1 Tax=Trichinella nativa TaxID=6335 RepID=A0A1Y3EUA7_9BILA|nr:hypothetical protein D917_00074 [Trichinella nativa]